MASTSASSAMHDTHVEAAGCDRSGSGDQWRETDVVNWDGGLGCSERGHEGEPPPPLITLPPVASVL
jgi:hypothetical protein